MEKLKRLGKYSAAITFLALEFIALIAFNFSGSFVVFGALSLTLMVLLVLFNIGEIKVNGLSNVGLFFIPLFMFVLLTAISPYSMPHMKLGDFSVAEICFIPLGILPIAFIGYLLSIDRNFKIKNLLIVVFGALAIYTLLNLIVNLINFGAFYTIVYKGYHLYYGGLISQLPVNDFAYTLEGFKFIEVEMSHYVLYPALLLTSSVMLLYLSPRKEKVSFIVYAVYTLIAVLSLILVPSLLSLSAIIVVALLLLVIFLGKQFVKSRKVFKIVLFIFLGIFGVGYLVYLLNNQAFASGISNIIANNGLLNKLFNTNKYAQAYNPTITNIFNSNHIFGFASIEVAYEVYEELHLSGGFIFDTFMTSGVFGAIALFAFIIIGFKSFKKYFYSHSDEFHYGALMLLFAIVFIGYSTFFNSGEYALYYRIYRPIYMTAPFMLVTLFFVYSYSKGHPYIQPVKEEIKNEEI